MLETLLYAVQCCLPALQTILSTLTQISGLCIGFYLFDLAIGREELPARWVTNIAKFCGALFVLACVVNLSFAPVLSLISGLMAGMLFGLFAAFLDRPITVPRD